MEKKERNQEIVEERKQGATYAQLAKKYGMSKQSVATIIKRNEQRKDPFFQKLNEFSHDAGFTFRIFNSLKRRGIHSIDELVLLEENEIKRLRNCGKESFPIIRAVIEKALEENPELAAIKKMN